MLLSELFWNLGAPIHFLFFNSEGKEMVELLFEKIPLINSYEMLFHGVKDNGKEIFFTM